jgi:xylan 1,4-beta-xylosidase
MKNSFPLLVAVLLCSMVNSPAQPPAPLPSAAGLSPGLKAGEKFSQDESTVRTKDSTKVKAAAMRGFHVSDNADGTYTNPVMPNAHWADASVVRVGDEFFCMNSSPDAVPLMQVLRSKDLVNWDVAGSVLPDWPKEWVPAQNWSPRICHVNGKFRVMFHITAQNFLVMEASRPEGPWEVVPNRFSDMTKQWAANIFTDQDGSHYMIAANWIQKTSPDALSFVGERKKVVFGPIIENPSLIRKGEFYYWFESINGSTTLGNDPSGGKLAVWRARSPMGPYEPSPHDFITANTRFQIPNSGSAVLGPDGNWWFLYNTCDSMRMTMCRQLHLDPITWDQGGWPVVNNGKGPGLTNRKPIDGFSPTWLPELTDEFDQSTLEGLTSGTLGRKWLKRWLTPEAWSVSDGWLKMDTSFPGLCELISPNLVFQRPTAAHYEISTRLRLLPTGAQQQAGLLVRETTTGIGLAIGLEPLSGALDGLNLVVWHSNDGQFKPMTTVKMEGNEVYLRILMQGMMAQTFFSTDGKIWERVGPKYYFSWNARYFATFYPGLFAGQSLQNPTPGRAEFDYFHYTPEDRW